MQAWTIYICRVVIAVSAGAFVAGWIVCGTIQGDALYQPTKPEGEYVHELPFKRSHSRYITTSQQQMLDTWRPIIVGSWIFAFIGMAGIGILDDARRDAERRARLHHLDPDVQIQRRTCAR